eukprot:95242_1
MVITNNLKRYKSIFKHYKNISDIEMIENKMKINKCTYTKISISSDRGHCAVCQCLDYSFGDMVKCTVCDNWYHYGKNGTGACQERRYNIEFYETHNFKCDSCKSKKSSNDSEGSKTDKVNVTNVTRDEFILYAKNNCVGIIDTLLTAIEEIIEFPEHVILMGEVNKLI